MQPTWRAEGRLPVAKRGAPIVAMGVLGIVFVGGAIVATGLEHPEPKPSRSAPVAPPPVEPGPLDQADAVAMATAQLALMVGSAKGAPARLEGVDGSESSLRVEGRHAQLLSLRVRIGTERDWRRVGACYELENEWRLTWLGTSPRCLPSR